MSIQARLFGIAFATAVAVAPFAASAVTLTSVVGPNDYSMVDTTATTTLPQYASWTAAPTIRTGNVAGIARSPFDETTSDTFSSSLAGAEALSYFAVSADNPANPSILSFTKTQTSLSFLWGSPDTYNGLTFWLNGAQVGGSFNQTDVTPPYTVTVPPTGNVYVTFSGLFDEVQFASSSNAFEFSNLSATPIPLPAAGWLLLAGLGALGAAGARRRRQTDA